MSEHPDDVSRREFLGSAALTAGGAAAGLSYYFTRPSLMNLDRYRASENQVGLAYIGIGNRGSALLRSSLQVPGVRPVGVADVRKEQVEEAVNDVQTSRGRDAAWRPAVSDYKVKVYKDYREALDDKEVEAVTIATPLYLHGPMAMDAIEAGKHVYCEKAMAFTIGENQDLYRMVKARPKLVFQVGHQRHYSPLYLKVKEMVDRDLIGNIAAIRAQWNQNDEVRRLCPDPKMEKVINWRLYSEFSAGLTTEFASHQVDVANWLLGTHPDSVCGYGGVDWYQDGRDTQDNIHLIFNYKVPIIDRDEYGRPRRENGDQGKVLYKKEGERVALRNVRFTYNSLMQNAHLRSSEMILGEYGTIEVSLTGGGEFFKEDKARKDPNRIAEGTNPKRSLQRRILKSGSTVDPNQASIRRAKGDPILTYPLPGGNDPVLDRNRGHWVEFTEPIPGSYDAQETLLAIGGFVESILASRRGEDFKDLLRADVEVGLWGAVPCLMANIAMREERTVTWDEFFGGSDTASR